MKCKTCFIFDVTIFLEWTNVGLRIVGSIPDEYCPVWTHTCNCHGVNKHGFEIFQTHRFNQSDDFIEFDSSLGSVLYELTRLIEHAIRTLQLASIQEANICRFTFCFFCWRNSKDRQMVNLIHDIRIGIDEVQFVRRWYWPAEHSRTMYWTKMVGDSVLTRWLYDIWRCGTVNRSRLEVGIKYAV